MKRHGFYAQIRADVTPYGDSCVTLMKRIGVFQTLSSLLIVVSMILCTASDAVAETITFEGLGNGQHINTPFEVSPLVDIHGGAGMHLGAAIFDSTVGGPNDFLGAPDLDLLVDLGNILILQENNSPNMTGDFFDEPNDESHGGEVIFDFLHPIRALSIDLVDIDTGAATDVILTDILGLQRVYSTPDDWTTDVLIAPMGWQTLDLTTLANQSSAANAMGGDATVMEDLGFDAGNVIQMVVNFSGSGAVDNLHVTVPEPSTLVLLVMAAFSLVPLALRRS